MKFILSALMMLTSALSFAHEVLLIERPLPVISSSFYISSDARFHMDTRTGEGFVKVVVTEDRWLMGGHYDSMGRWYPRRMPMPVTLLTETIPVHGLRLIDDKMIYQHEAGETECGRLGTSRVLKRPTLYLNGNCQLQSRVSGQWQDARLKVTLTIK